MSKTKHVISAEITEFFSDECLSGDWLDNPEELIKKYPHGCLRRFSQDFEVDKEMVEALGTLEEDSPIHFTDLYAMSKGELGAPSINLGTGVATYLLPAHVFKWELNLYKKDFFDTSAFEALGWQVQTSKLSAGNAKSWEKAYGWI